MIRVVAFNGSPRKNSNTEIMIRRVFEELEKEQIVCEHIQIGGHLLHGCKGCGYCRANPGTCVFKDDPMNEWIGKLVEADGFLLGCPTYFANVTSEMKAFIDRAGYVTGGMPGGLAGKVGAPVVVARRGGAMQTYNALMAFMGIKNVIVPCSTYWNMGYGLMPGDVSRDGEAMGTMSQLGKSMAALLKKLKAAA